MAHPQAAHSPRSYTPETESAALDLQRIYTYLAHHRFTRLDTLCLIYGRVDIAFEPRRCTAHVDRLVGWLPHLAILERRIEQLGVTDHRQNDDDERVNWRRRPRKRTELRDSFDAPVPETGTGYGCIVVGIKVDFRWQSWS